jgi:hypothetical protein
MVKIVAFARAFTNAGEHRYPAVEFGNVVDQFHDHHSLAHAGTPEGADLAAFQERANQVDDLDPGRQDLWRSRLVFERWSRPVNRIEFICLYRSAFIHGVARHIEHAAHDPFAHRHGDGLARIRNLQAALQAFRARHGDRPYAVIPELLLHFERQLHLLFIDLKFNGQSIVDRRHFLRELHVHDRADDLNDFAFVHT